MVVRERTKRVQTNLQYGGRGHGAGFRENRGREAGLKETAGSGKGKGGQQKF